MPSQNLEANLSPQTQPQSQVPGAIGFRSNKERNQNIIPVNADTIKVPNTLGLVGPNMNNPFIADEIQVKDQVH